MFTTIKPGDRVTIETKHGQKITGRAIMFNCAFKSWVLNTGGAHGTPSLATAANTIKVTPARCDGFAKQAAIINGGA